MANQGDVAKFYKRKQIESATPGQLVVLLYEGAIEYLNRAERALGQEGNSRYEHFHNNLIACQNILTELSVSLDMELGGEIAENLYRLYDYMNYRLVDANMEKDLKGLHEVKELLSTLREAWIEVVKKETTSSSPGRSAMGLNLKG
ncbi:MAG: flagellar export chaperone FliS [Chlamydiia bacterium]|nr:flagellar export chaperone FliS [Chlamydiia bacterium]